MFKTLASGILAACLLAGCASAPTLTSAPTAPLPAPVATDFSADNLNAVAWTQTAIEHDLIYREVYRDAQQQLLAARNDPHWDALTAADRGDIRVAGLKPAVIVDVDETVLDNSPYQARVIRDHDAYQESTWDAWCREEAAKPLPGALAFAQFAAAHGITMIYITNRIKALDAATLANLRKVGFPVADDSLYLGLGTVVPGCQQVGSSKSCRRKLIAKKYRILMQFGDAIGDFVDVSDNSHAGRAAAMAPYLDWIGERWFVLPNPTYGSWEAATFGNNWSLPAAERHARKIQSLRFH